MTNLLQVARNGRANALARVAGSERNGSVAGRGRVDMAITFTSVRGRS